MTDHATEHRDYGTAIWSELDIVGREAYLTDAAALVAAVKALGWAPALTPTDDERKLARAMARVEQLSDHTGIPYVYETGHGPVRPTTAPPVYLAADLWDALGAPAGDFDAYYERNRWADTWSNLLGTVRDRFRPKCGQDTEGEPCVLTAGHLPPHYGPSDVGSHEPVPVPEPQGEPSDAPIRNHGGWDMGLQFKSYPEDSAVTAALTAWNTTGGSDRVAMRAALRAAGGVR